MIRILIVEDEKPISNLIKMSLTKAGYHCTCVYDGIAAADVLDKEKFDKLEEKLSEKGITKKKWLNDKVDEEIGN